MAKRRRGEGEERLLTCFDEDWSDDLDLCGINLNSELELAPSPPAPPST